MDPFDTIYPADSTEFCPHPDATDIFVCGTYKLEQPLSNVAEDTEDETSLAARQSSPQKRTGRCLVFQVDSPEDLHLYVTSRTPDLLLTPECSSQIQAIDMPAILDMKWCHTTQDRRPLLAIANAEGEVTLHEWDKDQKLLQQTGSIRCAPPDVLCLSLDWSNRRFPTSTMGSLVVSLSNGEVALLEPNPETGLRLTDTWHAHDFEPWIAAWDYWDPDSIFSGGDDLKLKIWDKRQGFDTPTMVNKRFDAGITTIQSHPHVEHIFAVGSYDSTVRLYDRRKPLTPLTEADVSGGAWRVKWHPAPNRNHDLLVACMHDSFKIIKFRDIWEPGQPKTAAGQNWEIAQTFDKHESLGYGVDWSFSPSNGSEPGNTLIASASFYDHALHLWKG
ncbi:hypothetical protein EVG20_g1211 [Dentipellis fragilis]|uniref:methylated diphthine methylhydrolase n=1 Tax=Dentipellis fragilis TaxID=205917 RepID=A0A4Y9ZCV4_9AGAM|nr:hypothetical protein EVG20_g1211 [Dentipellis fragilis]